MNKKHLSAIIVVAVAILLLTVTYVVASYVMTSNHLTGTPSAQVTMTITTSNTAPTTGVPFTVTAHISDNSPNIPIALYNGQTLIQTSNSDISGTAAFTVTVSAAYDFYATATHP
jgi:hypothetical protein